MATLLLLVLLLNDTEVICLEKSEELDLIVGLKQLDNHYYAFNLDGLYVYDTAGRFLAKPVGRGQGPHEIDFPLKITKTDQGIWIASNAKAILVKGSDVLRTIKNPGLLVGNQGDDFLFQKIGRKQGKTYQVMYDNRKRKESRWFLEASEEEKRNGFRINDMIAAMKESYVAYGSGFTNKCYITNLESNETVPLEPELKGMVLYDLKQHGTVPMKPTQRNIVKFADSFDSFKSTNNAFFIDYLGKTHLLVYWNMVSIRSSRVQVFRLDGTLVGVQDYAEPPLDADQNGMMLFIQYPKVDGEKYCILKQPLRALMGF